jgi:phospholipase C
MRATRWTGFFLALLVALAAALGAAPPAPQSWGEPARATSPLALAGPGGAQAPSVPIDHVVVIYLENRSFDNLFGLFPGADGLANATDAPPQVDREGRVYATPPQPLDIAVTPPRPHPAFPPDLPNRPFDIGEFVPPDQQVTNLTHLYYRQQYQINGGRMDKFAAWNDSAGLAMGYYDGHGSELWRWAQEYTLADRFFHAAFGGSFLNHLWLVCACTPFWPHPPAELVSAPFRDYPDYLEDKNVRPDGYAVNTTQPLMPPYRAGTPEDQRLPLQTVPHIGDRLDAAGVSWAYYAGGWDDAAAGHPGSLFQYHHQPFNYFANVGGDPDVRARHLKDESDFIAALWTGRLPQVAWIKPYGTYNQHPGYTDVLSGDAHAGELLRQIQASPYWPRVAVIVTYDENGGFWDHVPPPVVDEWGPGARVPTLIVSPWARRGFVDHTLYDTTSILRFIEWRWSLPPLGTRDASANNLLPAFDFTQAPPRVPKG